MRSRRLIAGIIFVGLLGAAAIVDQDSDDAVETSTSAPVPGLAMPVAPTLGSLSSTWYCAGGTADEDGFANHTVVVANTGNTTVEGDLTVIPGAFAPKPPSTAGSSTTSTTARPRPVPEPVENAFRLGPRRRLAFVLSDIVDAPLASAVVEARGAPVVVEHQIAGDRGFDVAPCASAASSEWHFAWGVTRRDARETLVFFNPFPDDATLDVTFSTDDGPRDPVRFDGFVVPGRSVVGVDVGDDVTRRDHVAATVRTRAGHVVVDRIQRYDGSLGVEGITLTLGSPTPAEVWVFPDGRVSEGVVVRYAIFNPNDRPAEAELEIRLVKPAQNGEPEPFNLTIPANGFEVVTLNDEDRIPRGIAHAAIVRSLNGVGLVAERILFALPPARRRGVSATPGSPFAAPAWALASGSATDRIDEWLTIVNLSTDEEALVSVSALAGGQLLAVQDLQEVAIPPSGRLAIRLGDHVQRPDLPLVVAGSAPIVVERGLYLVDGLGIANSMAIPFRQGLVVPPPLQAG